jgi:mRNA-degrading endonuclease RelE of RelBE toxin-antitoxin system
MKRTELKDLFYQLFEIDITDSKFRDFDFEKKFAKKVFKLKGKETYNLLNKIIEIISSEDLTRYKNLKYDLKKYKRVHVNDSYVIVFYDDKDKKVYFIDYEHHDRVYEGLN